ncbi:MAG: hypothetical protein LBT23_06155 [Synergistaceae bacterium]|jgi:hypothetical protein|nr:hypothetical protein [Synergistaceae bacterium]
MSGKSALRDIVLIQVILLLAFSCGVALADQAALITEDKAKEAAVILARQDEVKLLCEPCGDIWPAVTGVSDVSIKNEEEAYWAVYVNGNAIDLAYTYVSDGGRWVNLAKKLSLDVSGVSGAIYDEPAFIGEPVRDYVKITITGDNVNLRSGPGQNTHVLAKAKSGDFFVARASTIKNEDDRSVWYRIVCYSDKNSELRLANNSVQYGYLFPCVSARFTHAEPLDDECARRLERLKSGGEKPPESDTASVFNWSERSQRLLAASGLPGWGQVLGGATLRELPSKSAKVLKQIAPYDDSFFQSTAVGVKEDDGESWYEIPVEGFEVIGWVRADEFEFQEESPIGRFMLHVDMTLHSGAKSSSFLDQTIRIFGPLLSRDDTAWWHYGIDAAILGVTQEFSGATASFYLTLASSEAIREEEILWKEVRYSRPGFGLGGIFCGVSWCDRDYVRSLLSEPDDATHSEDGEELWRYQTEWGNVNITFDGKGQVKEVLYISGTLD